MHTNSHRTSVVIVGAGPIGIELAVALRHHGVALRQFDAGTVGQTITWYPREVRFFSSPERIALAGVPFLTAHQEKATREEYLSYLRSIVGQFDLKVETHRRVTSIEPDGDGFRLEVAPSAGQPSAGALDRNAPRETVLAEKVVLAIGDMHRPRKLGISGEDLPHVSHYFTEPHEFFDRKLLIIGGKNSAAEAALRCHRAGAHVHISYRRAAFPKKSVKAWLFPDLENQVARGKIGFSPETVPVEITRDTVRLKHAATGEESELEADFVLAMIGYEQDPELFEMCGVKLEGTNGRPALDTDTMQTAVPGLFVAGTAVAGTQDRFKLFIENSHPHVQRIVRAITGKDAPFETRDTSRIARDLPES